MRGDTVAFESMGAVPIKHVGEVLRFIPAGTSALSGKNVVEMIDDFQISQLPKRRRRFKEVNTRSDRYLVAVHRKDKNNMLLNSIDYYAPIAERVKKYGDNSETN